MTYCLITEDGKVRVEIRCTLANRPDTIADLIIGVHDGNIEMIKPKKMTERLQKLSNDKLDTDWARNGVQPMYINWIPTENL